EQWTENPCVPGSIPGGTTRNPQSICLEGFFLPTILILVEKTIFIPKIQIQHLLNPRLFSHIFKNKIL
ncbi:MAG: hypothetical protein ACPHXR_07905, partial [Flavicella sp.]